MKQPKAILDSDILSAIMRGEPTVLGKAESYLCDYGRFTFSAITRYEILRGLKYRDARGQLHHFEARCRSPDILPFDDAVIQRAATIYADLRVRGKIIQDADIFIAATALEHGLVVVTNNENHFIRIPGLHVENWLKPATPMA